MIKLKYILALSFITCNSYAGDFEDALATVRTQCSGISDELSDLKTMAGINTAVTGVGTVTATGATVAGLAKTVVDKDLERILGKIPENIAPKQPDEKRIMDLVAKKWSTKNPDDAKPKIEKASKSLGDWRTGLVGTSTATNVAGAIIAGNNKLDEDLQTRIDECIKSVESLKDAIGQARMDGLDVTQASKIVTECGEWKNADLSAINDRAKGAMISSIIGATTGTAGTVTSAMANSDSVRKGNDKKEKNLNTAANVLSGGTAVASGVATVFNATQISAIKKIVNIADNCENALK